MTASQLARYWQLVNADGEPMTGGIMKWTKRSESEHYIREAKPEASPDRPTRYWDRGKVIYGSV